MVVGRLWTAEFGPGGAGDPTIMMISRPDPSTVPVDLRRDLLRRGETDRTIAGMLRSGAWTRVRHGAYTDAALWRQLDDAGRHQVRIRAVVAAARADVVVSHVSAALAHGAPEWGLPLDDVHVTRRDGRIGRHEAGVHQHGGLLAPDDVVEIDGLSVCSATRTALEICTLVPTEVAVGVVSHLLHRGLTDLTQLRARHADATSGWPHSHRTHVVLRLASEMFESVGESRTFYLLWAAGLPLPVPQYEVHDETGRVIARVDFAWPDLGVFLEFDGRVKYERLLRNGERASDVVVREKRREDEIRRVTGWRGIRLTWGDLDRAASTATMLRGILVPPGVAG